MAITPARGSFFLCTTRQSPLLPSVQANRQMISVSLSIVSQSQRRKCLMESSTHQQWGMQEGLLFTDRATPPQNQDKLGFRLKHKVGAVPLVKIWEKNKCHSAESFLFNNIFGWVLLSIINGLPGYLKHNLEPSLPHQAWPFKKLVLF